MGTGISINFLNAGISVRLLELNKDALDRGVGRIREVYDSQLKKGKLDAVKLEARMALLKPALDYADITDVDLVIEAVFEEMSVKEKVFRTLDGVVRQGAILATNTSTLPVVEMAVATGRPDRVCGVHFFNPAPAMSLVEIVRPLTGSDEVIAAVTAFGRSCGKEPVEVADRAGFIVNALLFPYLNNAVKMLENGVASRDDIDTAMKGGCNFPMGPLALLDLVGLDTSVAILDALYTEFHDPNYSPAPRLRRMVSAGHLGRKSGVGFYDYRK